MRKCSTSIDLYIIYYAMLYTSLLSCTMLLLLSNDNIFTLLNCLSFRLEVLKYKI